ncbi:MAG: YfhO family protein [Candidatus Eisenbacteria bacterium]
MNALMPADIGRVFEAVHPRLWPDKRRIAPFTAAMGDAIDRPLWSLLNVGVFLGPGHPLTRSAVYPDDLILLSREKLAVDWPPEGDFLGASPVVAKNEEVLPRAFLRHRYEVVPGREEILARITAPDFDSHGPLLLEEDPGLPQGGAAAIPADECVLVERRGGNAEFLVRSNEPGLLFLSETWYPGWEAEVDGDPAPLFRADYAFRAVPVPAGEHVVSFRYRPRSFRAGVAGSLIAVILWAGIALPGIRRRAHLSR